MDGESGLPSLLLQAAHSAAQADGLTDTRENSQSLGLDHALAASQNRKGSLGGGGGGGGGGAGGKKKGPPLRRGKWTPEEEAYANRLIQEFKAGLLPLTDGTTLRTFLSKLLNCDPMRISKKFVGSNCIGKQVFRRRTADINRLTPEQIQQSRAELSELERRFLERVAQTNRVKSSGVGGGGGPAAAPSSSSVMGMASRPRDDQTAEASSPSPPWLQPPLGYKQGAGAAMAAANLSGGGESNSRAAAAGRALLQGLGGGSLKNLKDRRQNSDLGLGSQNSADLLAELQHRASHQMFSQDSLSGSASNILAAAAAARNGNNSAFAQIAHNASAARLAAGGNSMNSLMMKTGLSRDQLSKLARDKGLSSASLSNMMERQNSFDALMSLDFQSLQSIDNLANLIQTGGAGQVPEGGMKNWSADAGSRSNLAAAAAAAGSNGNLSSAARRLASAGRMESFLRSLSSHGNLGNNFGNDHNSSGFSGGGGEGGVGGNSNANFSNLLQSMQSNLNNLGNNNSSSNFFTSNRDNNDSNIGGGNNSGNMTSAASLANLLRGADSSTGLTALRLQEGLNQRNTSVDDFLSLVAAGDIPHQDASLLDISLMQQQGGNSDSQTAAAFQRQLLAQAAQSRSFGNLNLSSSASALMAAAQDRNQSSNEFKRKLLDLQGSYGDQGPNKR